MSNKEAPKVSNILHVTDDALPNLSFFLGNPPGEPPTSYRIATASSLEKALKMKNEYYSYDAVVMDYSLQKGSISNASEAGLMDLAIEDFITLGDIGINDDTLRGHSLNDGLYSLILASLLRLPVREGGIGFKGGIVIYSAHDVEEIKEVFGKEFHLRRYDEGPLKRRDILYVSKDPSADQFRDIPESLKLAARYTDRELAARAGIKRNTISNN